MEAIASNGEIINTGDPVLVRFDNKFNWRYTIFSHKCDEGTYATCYGNHVQCIPYKGNEYLVGTNNSWKSYKDKQNEWIKEHNIKIGDEVKIIKKSFKCNNECNSNIMNIILNRIGTITYIDIDSISVYIEYIGTFKYPYYILKKIEDDNFEFKFNARVKGITYNDINVEGNLIGYNENDRYNPYLVRTTKSQGCPTNGVMFWCKKVEYI